MTRAREVLVGILTTVMLLASISLLVPAPVTAEPDTVTILSGDLSRQAHVFKDGAVVGIVASDGVTTGGNSWANVTDSANPTDFINVTLYDDGTHGDKIPNDGDFMGNFTIVDDEGTSGFKTDNSSDILDLQHGHQAIVNVDLDQDGNGSAAFATADFRAPVITIKSKTGFFRDTFRLNVSVEDDNLNSSSVGYYVDDTNFSLFPSFPDFPAPGPVDFMADLDTSTMTEAEHTARVRAVDEAGNVNDQISITFTVDRTAPGMEIPFEGGFVTGDITITVTIIIIVEGEAPVVASSVTYTIDSGAPVPFTQIAEFTYEAIIITALLTEGPHTLAVNSMDAAGNEGSNTWDIIVDNTVPTVEPGTFDWHGYGSLTADFGVSDTYLSTGTVQYQLDGGGWFPCYQEGPPQHCSVQVDKDKVPPGEHTLEVVAEDEAGNSMTLSTTFTVPKRPGPCKDCVVKIESNGDVTLDWSDSTPPISHYRIYVSNDPNISSTFGSQTPKDTTTESNYNLGVIQPGKTYVLIIPVGDEMFGDPCFVGIDYPVEDYEKVTVGDPSVVQTKPKDDDILTVSTPVTNDGPIPVDVEVKVLIDGKEVANKTVTVPGNSTETVIITMPPQPKGEHTIDVIVERPEGGTPGGEIGKKKIPVTIEPSEPPGPPSNPLMDNPFTTFLEENPGICFILILLLLLLIGGGVYAGTKKKKPRPSAPGEKPPEYPRKPEPKEYPTRPPRQDYPSRPTDATSTSATGTPTSTTPSTTTMDPTSSAIATETPFVPIAAPTVPKRDRIPPEQLSSSTEMPGPRPEETSGYSTGTTPATPSETMPVGTPETPGTAVPETPPITISEISPPTEPVTSQVPTTPEAPTTTTTHTSTGTSEVPGGVPPVIPTIAMAPERRGPCDGIKQQWDALKADAERKRAAAEAADADVPVKKKEAEDKRQEATEARKEAEEARKPMDEKEEALRKREAQRDQLVQTIMNTIDGASTTPVDGWEQYTGAEGGRNTMVPGRIWLAPGNAAVEDYLQTIEKWKDQLKAAKEKEAEARKEYEDAKKEFDDANEEANKAEAEADAAELAHRKAAQDAEAKRADANAAIAKANKFADEWRHCIKERLSRLTKRAEAWAEEGKNATSTRPTNPEEAENAADAAQKAADNAQEARDQLKKETDGIDDPELSDDLRDATRRADDAVRRANNTASIARRRMQSMPRQCTNGDRKTGRRYTKRRRYLDEDGEIMVDYDPMYGPDGSGKLEGAEAAAAMAEVFEKIGKGTGKVSGVIPKGGEIVKVPLKFIDFYMKAGSAMITKAVDILDEHYKRLGWGTLTVKVPVIRITETWEARYICEHGMWVREQDVKIDEKMEPGYESHTRKDVSWKNIPWWTAELASRVPRR